MASLDLLLEQTIAGKRQTRRTVDDSAVVLRIKHISTGTATPTVTLSDTGSDITLVDGDAVTTTCDLSNASYNTVGEVADYINASAGWKCKVMDALRADASNDKWLGTTIAAAVVNGETVYDILQDTSGLGDYKVRVAYDYRVQPTTAKGYHRVTLDNFSYKSDLTAAADKVQIWEYDPIGKTETKLLSWTSVDTTVIAYTSIGDVTPRFPFQGITVENGKELIVVVTGTVVDYASGYLSASSYTE